MRQSILHYRSYYGEWGEFADRPHPFLDLYVKVARSIHTTDSGLVNKIRGKTAETMVKPLDKYVGWRRKRMQKKTGEHNTKHAFKSNKYDGRPDVEHGSKDIFGRYDWSPVRVSSVSSEDISFIET